MSPHRSQLAARTRAIREGYRRTHEREHNEAIFTTSSFVFDSAEQAAALFSGAQSGNVYSRFTNPTVQAFEARMAALEGGAHGIAFASGMAAITTMLLALLRAGDHIVASSSLFGSSVTLFSRIISRFDIQTTFVDLTRPSEWAQAATANTRLFYLESPSNPLCRIADLRKIAAVARRHNAVFAVDNAFCTPVLQQPLAMGADLVVHTATKYLDGQGRCVGGALVMNDDRLHADIFACLRSTGACMTPFNAWVFSKGLETLHLRMREHCANAAELAGQLQAHPAVETVYYPGLPEHPQHALAKRQLQGFGGIVSFTVSGDRAAAWQVINTVRLLSITANLGDTKTTITHPATTTHARISQQQRDQAQIGENLLRVSVGLEDPADIFADLRRALDQLIR